MWHDPPGSWVSPAISFTVNWFRASKSPQKVEADYMKQWEDGSKQQQKIQGLLQS